ncbi:hypothetical protein MJT46_004068 [Ovis ammon polii x Ovis aries]|nr:hypothetical protein MJT46_004068 [Ovis ammon polii x Ovis aries]
MAKSINKDEHNEHSQEEKSRSKQFLRTRTFSLTVISKNQMLRLSPGPQHRCRLLQCGLFTGRKSFPMILFRLSITKQQREGVVIPISRFRLAERLSNVMVRSGGNSGWLCYTICKAQRRKEEMSLGAAGNDEFIMITEGVRVSFTSPKWLCGASSWQRQSCTRQDPDTLYQKDKVLKKLGKHEENDVALKRNRKKQRDRTRSGGGEKVLGREAQKEGLVGHRVPDKSGRNLNCYKTETVRYCLQVDHIGGEIHDSGQPPAPAFQDSTTQL